MAGKSGSQSTQAPKKPLTDLRVKDFKHVGPGQSFLRDYGTGSVSGLAVRATAGEKVFVFERRHNGKLFRIKIGKVAERTVVEARIEAKKLAAQIDAGIDPREAEKAQQAAQAMQGATVADLWKRFIEANESRWSAHHLADNLWIARAPKEGSEAGPLWPLMGLPVSRINAATLIQWAKDLTAAQVKKMRAVEKYRANGDTPVSHTSGRKRAKETPVNPKGLNLKGKNSALRKSFVQFRAFWRWAHGRPEDFGNLASPEMFSHGDLRALLPRRDAKTDVLQKSQLAPWFKAVGAISNPVISAYLQVLLLTGARREELAELKWSDVSFEWKSLHLKDKVEAQGRAVPLTPYCEYLIERLRRKNEKELKELESKGLKPGKHFKWVFSSPTSESGRITEPRIAHKRALSVAGLPGDLSIHGLRRSFKSLSEWVELPVGIVAQIMGHKPSATAEKHYTVRPLELLAQWHVKLETWILEQAGVVFNPEAVAGPRIVKEPPPESHNA